MPRCVDCGTETPREEMYGSPDELRCRACVQRRFPTTNVPTRHRSSFFLRWPPVTTFVVAAAVTATVLSWSYPNAVDWMAASQLEVWEWQLWRLFTTVLLHSRSNFLHLAFDAFWMWRLGKPVENWMGSLRFAGFFVAAAVGSSAAEFLAGHTGIGLSGVVYALVGLLFVLSREEQFAAELMPPRLLQFFVVWFFVCIALTYANWYPVANYAHGAGAVIGWLFGRAIVLRWRVVATVGVSLLCAALALATLYMPWNGGYDFHRGLVCGQKKDYAGALKWYELAARHLSGENQERAQHNVRWARYMMEHGDEDDQ